MTDRHQSRRTDMPPQGYVQQCLPMYQAPAATVSDAPVVPDEPPVQLTAQTFVNLATALQAAFCDLAELRERYTALYGKKAERLLERVQEVVCEQMTLQEHHFDQQEVLARLRRLYVECRSALVTVRGVCGLCETGRLLCEPTGAYWQFGDALLLLRRSCQAVATLFKNTEGTDKPVSACTVLSA